ncbi:uncharacterized protein [Antedon mediterranea]|uniref:uncharacterized protein n=1 Tax=Antedon mediterranea TaxID=105859 RepID=UPI003AF50859
MPLQCSAQGCKYHDKTIPREKGITFHRFPHRDSNRLWIWVMNMNVGKWMPKARTLLCSRHFTPDNFEMYKGKTRLKHTAIPTIFVFPEDIPQPPETEDNTPKPNKFQSACLTAHNTVREEFGIPQMNWSDDAATTAKEWAKKLANKGYLQHSENRVYGENILITEDKENVSGSQVVESWLEEVDAYKFDMPMWQYNTSHFTQMVWKNSTDFGVAKAKMRNKNKYVIVAHYKPIGNGNMPGEYKKNVPANKVNVSLDVKEEPESDPESEPEPEHERSPLTRTPSKRKAEEIVRKREESVKRAASDAVGTDVISEDVVQQEVIKAEYNNGELHEEGSLANKLSEEDWEQLNGIGDMEEFDDDQSSKQDYDEGEEVVQEDEYDQEVKERSSSVSLKFMENGEDAGELNGNVENGISDNQDHVVLNREYSDGEDTEV